MPFYDWKRDEELDSVAAAPDSHSMLLENERVRVLKVILEPGTREPLHTHRWPGIFILTAPARIRYYGEDGQPQFETAVRIIDTDSPPVEMLSPEGLHAVENIDTFRYEAFRIELQSGGSSALPKERSPRR